MDSNLSSTKTTTSALPCIAIHELAQELSCPICLEIFFEPCTAPCGHNFCRKCLRLRSNCCPICRKLIGIGKSCTVNTVLWNTVQLLFPKEVEARQAIDASSNPKNLASSRGLNYVTEYDEMGSDLSSTTCIHKLTREFSCSLCSEIFFEPSTTTCGHNFCRKCLPSFIVNSGQSCPICRQWIRYL